VSEADLACPARRKTMPMRLALAAVNPTAVTTVTAVTPVTAVTAVTATALSSVSASPTASGKRKPKDLAEKCLETMEITLTPCFVEEQLSKAWTVPAERRKARAEGELASGGETKNTDGEMRLAEQQNCQDFDSEEEQEGEAKKECAAIAAPAAPKVQEPNASIKEDNVSALQDQNHVLPQEKGSRSVSLDSDLDLSEEEESGKDDVEDNSSSRSRTRLLSDTDHEELSDDERSHKRRCVDKSDEVETGAGTRPVSPSTGSGETEPGEHAQEVSPTETLALLSPVKVDLTKRKYRNFLEELLRTFEADEREKEKELGEKRAALKQARQNYAYETFRDTLKRNLKHLKGSQNQKSFEAIVKSFCSLESDINKAAVCDYVYTIFMVGAQSQCCQSLLP